MKKVIPSGITFLSLLFGTAALWQYIYGEISTGLFLNLICVVLDGLDGYFARKLNACTKFGKVFDLIVDYCVFGLFLIPIPYRLYGADIWTNIIMMTFVGSHAVRVIINLRRNHTSYSGMPDTFVPIVIALVYFTLETKLLILTHYAMCALYMHHFIRYPRYADFQRIRAFGDTTILQALLILYLGCMLGLDWKSLPVKESPTI